MDVLYNDCISCMYIYIYIYVCIKYSIYIYLISGIHYMAPFSTEKGGGIFNILARLAPMVAASASLRTLKGEKLTVSRGLVGLYIFTYVPVVNGLNKLQQ